ncbi:hypothetical protein FGO68_gene11564 [Halteria grandinella]|uniref:Uncharacterized protein n=1 Tax=Halteria grandinella TaxID=5974 RepID=A0A8J8T2I9_HALGN|nr:hypothetical protein FGO68_gene11564 [Halteria grandinella]
MTLEEKRQIKREKLKVQEVLDRHEEGYMEPHLKLMYSCLGESFKVIVTELLNNEGNNINVPQLEALENGISMRASVIYSQLAVESIHKASIIMHLPRVPDF